MQMPVSFSQDIFDTICERIADGESLRAICRDKDMPSTRAVLNWLAKDESGPLVRQYARAREAAADANADDIGDIGTRTLAGEFDPQAARVAIDALKWSAGKRNPKKYGDKLAIGGDDDAPPIKHEVSARDRIASRIAGLAAAGSASGDTGEPE